MRITVHTGQPGHKTGDLFGIFFEDINHAADGGLYPEMVQNRSFEFSPLDHPSYHGLTAWEPLGEVKLSVVYGGAVSEKNPHYLSIDVEEPGEGNGVKNTGFAGGMFFQSGEKYHLTFYAKREQDLDQLLTVCLTDRQGRSLASASFELTGTWRQYTADLVPENTGAGGCLTLLAAGRGKVFLDYVSLMPDDTFEGLPFRKDIAEKLKALKPKFIRFPGGCLTHDGSLDPSARDAMYRWKNTIGAPEERPARRNNWNYNQTLGLGFYEYFLLAEAIGAKPIPVISPGYDPHHHREAPVSEMWQWIDDALHLIEFANGDETTEWGGIRQALGHEAPFGLEYLAIGNEEVGEAFYDRYKIVLDAVRRKHPEIRIIGTAGFTVAGGEFERGWKHARETATEIVDEHYYMAPEWFLKNTDRYDSYDRQGPKVFVGEYASRGNTWYNALSEAAYMTSLEQNADVVSLACYAPLLCNTAYVNWQPDLIYFDHYRVLETPNYKVQKLFMHNLGQETVPVEVEGALIPVPPERPALDGDIALGAGNSTVHYTEILARNLDTGEIRTYQNVDLDAAHPFKRLDTLHWSRYTVRLRARETAGKEGFKIYFGWRSEKDHLVWSIGGWQNQDSILSEVTAGDPSDISHYLTSVRRDREYEFTIRVDGREVTTEIDGKDQHHVFVRPFLRKPLYASAAKEGKEWILKVVNAAGEAKTAPVEFDTLIHLAGTRTVLTAPKDAVNTFEKPYNVSPVTEEFIMQSGEELIFPPYSLTIFRMKETYLAH